MSPVLQRLILYGCLAGVLIAFGFAQGASHEADALLVDQAHQLVGSHTTFQRVQDSLRGVERRFVGEEDFWRTKADSVGRANRDQSAPTKSDSVALSGTMTTPIPTDSLRVVFLGRALDACDAARGAVDSALARCASRADSLTRTLRDVLAMKKPRFGWFAGPCLLVNPSGEVRAGLCGGWGLRF